MQIRWSRLPLLMPLLVLALASGAASAATPWRLGPGGLGPFVIGMDFARAQALAPGLAATPPGLRASSHCDQLPLPGHPGVALMFVDGVLHRIDVFKPGIPTAAGVEVDAPAGSVERAYARVARARHAYDERESTLTVGPEHGRAIRFETHDGRIKLMYAGDWTQIQYEEGCL